MGSCRLNTHSLKTQLWQLQVVQRREINPGNSLPFLLANTCFGSEWFNDVLVPPFPSLHCRVLGMEQQSYQTTGGRQEQWSKLPKPTSSDPMPLYSFPLWAGCLHCALAPPVAEGTFSLQQLIKDPLPPPFPSYVERSLSLKATVVSMSISWLRLGSGTVNQTVPIAVLPCREGLACCKTKACICLKGLCWPDLEWNVSVQSPSLSLWNPTQRAECGWEELRSAEVSSETWCFIVVLSMTRPSSYFWWLQLSMESSVLEVSVDTESIHCLDEIPVLGAGHASASFRLTGFRNFPSREAGTGLITEVGPTY